MGIGLTEAPQEASPAAPMSCLLAELTAEISVR
jgi:hypothetical protein